MKSKKNKRLLNKQGLVNNKDRLLEICQTREEKIATFFNQFEHYSDSIKLLLDIQKCAFTSPLFESLNDFEREELQLRFPKVVELVIELSSSLIRRSEFEE